jgi:hypothetical protein
MTPRRSRPTRDPDRRPTPPKHPGFAQFPLDVDTDVCARCRALVPATEFARMKHQEWDQRIDAAVAWLATNALTEQVTKLVDPGSPPGPGSAPTPGAGAAGGRAGDAPAGRGPAPGKTSVAAGRQAPALARGDPGKAATDSTSPTARGGSRTTDTSASVSGAATPGIKSPPTPSGDATGHGGVEGANVPPGPVSLGPGGTRRAGRGDAREKLAPAGPDPDDDPWYKP